MSKTTGQVQEVVEEVLAADSEINEMEGFEEDALTLQSIPVMALAQSQTPEVVEGEIEGLKAGVLMNSTTKQPMGDKVEVVVYKMWVGRTKFPPREDNGPIECYSPDGVKGRTYGECKTCAFSDFNLKDRCLEQNFFLVAPVDNPSEVYRLIFAKSNKRAGQTLVNTLRSECAKTKRPIYGVKIAISTKRVKNEKANAYYYVFETKVAGLIEKDAFLDYRPTFLQMTEIRKASLEDFYATLDGNVEDEGSSETLESEIDAVAPGSGDELL